MSNTVVPPRAANLAVVTGDNHLRPRTWSRHPTLVGDSYDAFNQVVRYALENRLPLILLGDTFDKSLPDSRSVGVYMNAVEQMSRAGLQVYYICGNHDMADPPWHALHPAAVHAEEFTIMGVRFYGIDFTSAAQLPERLAEIPADTDVLLTHQAWREIQPVGHVDGDFSMLPRGMVVLTGDYHIAKAYHSQAANGEPVVAYSPGSTNMQAINEDPNKSFMVLCLDDDGKPAVLQRPALRTRPIKTVTGIRTEAQLAAAVQAIPQWRQEMQTAGLPENLQKPILHMRYDDTLQEAYVRIVAVAGEDWHLFLEPQRVMTDTTVDVTAAPEDAFESLITAVQTLAADTPDVRDAAIAILQRSNHTEAVQQLFTEFKTKAAAAAAAEGAS